MIGVVDDLRIDVMECTNDLIGRVDFGGGKYVFLICDWDSVQV